MEEKTTLLIADDSPELCDLLKEYFEETEEINVVDFARNGQEACEKIMLIQPDVVLLDVIMPRLDGIGVLKRMQKTKMQKAVVYIVMSAIASDSLAKSCMSCGAHYYVVKPFDDIGMLAERIKDLKRNVQNGGYVATAPMLFENTFYDSEPVSVQKSVNMEAAVTELMRDIGMPAHVKGYEFIRTAVLMCIEDRSIINSITKELYPEVAKLYDTNAPRVERAIRHAIELAWTRGKPEVINKIFGYTINNIKGKPTNGECIAMLADHLRITNNVS